MNYRIFPPDELIEAAITLPLSKSMSNRALIISALTLGSKLPEEVAVCDDTAALTAALCSSEPTVDIGAAGTAMRFLTAYFAALPGRKVTPQAYRPACRCAPQLRSIDQLSRRGGFSASGDRG